MNGIRILTLVLSLTAVPAKAEVPTLEQLEFAVCNSSGAVFYFTNLSPVVDEEVGFFEAFRSGFFVAQVSNPELPEEIVIGTHGTGKLSRALTKRIKYSFAGEGQFEHLEDVEFTLIPSSLTEGTGTLKVQGIAYPGMQCRIGVE